MKLKQWLKYLVYMSIILILVLLRVYITKITKEYLHETFRINFNLLIILGIINIILGLVLGLEHFVKEIMTVGTWKINIPKLVLLGLPSLYCSIVYFSVYIDSKFLHNAFVRPLRDLLAYDANILSLFQLILGYIVITSCYKDKSIINNKL